MKNSNNTIENRTRDLPTCSAVPQSPALPRALNTQCTELQFSTSVFNYQNEHNTLTTMHSFIFYNMFRPFVSAIIR